MKYSCRSTNDENVGIGEFTELVEGRKDVRNTVEGKGRLWNSGRIIGLAFLGGRGKVEPVVRDGGDCELGCDLV